MESMGTSTIPVIAAFFLGIMMAISPCPLATNITAIAYISRKIDNGKHTLLVGFSYALGRIFTYTTIASLIVFVSLNVQSISLPLQRLSETLTGPLLIVIGIIMFDGIRFTFSNENNSLYSLKERLSEKGYTGSFLLGSLFALAFCPFSGVLFFGMLIPLSVKTGDGILLPLVFAFATGLPVIIFSCVLVFCISRLGTIINKVQMFEKWTRKLASLVFISVGIYYSIV